MNTTDNFPAATSSRKKIYRYVRVRKALTAPLRKLAASLDTF